MAGRTNNTLTSFLLALRQSIIDAQVVPPAACQIATEERYLEYAQAQQIVMLIPGPMRPEDQGGSGEMETIYEGSITIRLIVQSALDAPVSDQLALTDDKIYGSTIGVYTLFQAVLPVVRFWDKCDSTGTAYLVQPLRQASEVTQPRRDREHSQYVYADMKVEYRICIA